MLRSERHMLDASSLHPEKPRPLRRVEYDRLVAGGAFEGERVELLYGTLVAMSPHDPPHSAPIQDLNELLVRALLGRPRVRVQLPVVACDESEPEPDLAVVPLGDYSREHPCEAHLIVEVAVSSLRKDREVKGPLYASSGFREYWIVNVPERLLEVYREPREGSYTDVTRLRPSETVRLVAFPDVELRVADVLPR
jgi:Uma2 family endonuclease